MAVPRTDGAGLQPLAAVTATSSITPLGDIRRESNDRLARLEIGRQYQAQILSRFNDGTYMVRIADTSARIALPGNGKVGDALALTLVATDPRPTFTLDASIPAAGLRPGSRIAQALYLSNAAPTAGLAPGTDDMPGTAAPAHVSATGRLIAELLNRRQELGKALTGTVPLSPVAGAGASQIASALQDTLAFSGLFYESHVSQWVNGERPLANLLREPQARNGTSAAGQGATLTAATSGEVPSQVAETRLSLLKYYASAPLPGAATQTVAGTDAAAAQMINLQLNTLEQQKVQWQGELWPGQPVQWEVRRDEQSAQAPGAEPAEQRWQSTVRFTLPSLGVISAVVNLVGDRVQIRVRTASEESATALRRHGAELASAFDAAGSALDNLTVRSEVLEDGDI